MISEIDIEDWDRKDPTPLFNVRPKSYIEVADMRLFFDHLDGMYSYCLTGDNEVVHISAVQIVTPLERKPK